MSSCSQKETVGVVVELSSSQPPRYSREDIVALKDTPAIIQLWNLNYKELIASEFPQLFVGNGITSDF